MEFNWTAVTDLDIEFYEIRFQNVQVAQHGMKVHLSKSTKKKIK